MPKNTNDDLKDLPPVPPEGIITDVYGGDEGQQSALDLWKEQHNKAVRDAQRQQTRRD